MRPGVSAVVQHVDAFVEICAQNAGRSVDIYVRAISASTGPSLTVCGRTALAPLFRPRRRHRTYVPPNRPPLA